jgi:hypothetical protein
MASGTTKDLVIDPLLEPARLDAGPHRPRIGVQRSDGGEVTRPPFNLDRRPLTVTTSRVAPCTAKRHGHCRSDLAGGSP